MKKARSSFACGKLKNELKYSLFITPIADTVVGVFFLREDVEKVWEKYRKNSKNLKNMN